MHPFFLAVVFVSNFCTSKDVLFEPILQPPKLTLNINILHYLSLVSSVISVVEPISGGGFVGVHRLFVQLFDRGD